MKHTKVGIKLLCGVVIVFFALPASHLHGRIGCMDTSSHLKTPYDYKNYRYVQCDCPCEKKYRVSLNRGVCPECGHYHAPQGFEIVKVDVEEIIKKQRNKNEKAKHNHWHLIFQRTPR